MPRARHVARSLLPPAQAVPALRRRWPASAAHPGASRSSAAALRLRGASRAGACTRLADLGTESAGRPARAARHRDRSEHGLPCACVNSSSPAAASAWSCSSSTAPARQACSPSARESACGELATAPPRASCAMSSSPSTARPAGPSNACSPIAAASSVATSTRPAPNSACPTPAPSRGTPGPTASSSGCRGTILHEHWRVEFRCRYFTRLGQLQHSLDGFPPQSSSEPTREIARRTRETVYTYAALDTLEPGVIPVPRLDVRSRIQGNQSRGRVSIAGVIDGAARSWSHEFEGIPCTEWNGPVRGDRGPPDAAASATSPRS